RRRTSRCSEGRSALLGRLRRRGRAAFEVHEGRRADPALLPSTITYRPFPLNGKAFAGRDGQAGLVLAQTVAATRCSGLVKLPRRREDIGVQAKDTASDVEIVVTADTSTEPGRFRVSL